MAKQARPKMCREMEKDGSFRRAVKSQAETARQAMRDGRKAGMSFEEARDRALQEVYLPGEEEQPELGGPMSGAYWD